MKGSPLAANGPETTVAGGLPSTPPMAGRRVGVTGPGGPTSAALSSRLRELGAEVIELPSITIGPPESWAEVDGALARLESFDWIVFASARAIDAFSERCNAAGVTAQLEHVQIAAVGEATGRRSAQLLRSPDCVSSDASGAGLATALAPLIRGKRILLPRAAEGRAELHEGLARAGAVVEAIAVYRTRPVPPEELRPLGDRLERGEIDAVTFTSPSAVRSVVAALGDRARLLARVALAAIGPTTAEAVEEAGFAVAVRPREASASALAEELARYLSSDRA